MAILPRLCRVGDESEATVLRQDWNDVPPECVPGESREYERLEFMPDDDDDRMDVERLYVMGMLRATRVA